MRSCIVREMSEEAFCKTLGAVGLVHLIVLSGGVCAEEAFAKELSEAVQCTVLASLPRAAVLADCGEILARVRPAYARDGSGTGDPRVRETSAGRIGMLVGEDVFVPEAARTLRRSGAEFAVALAPAASVPLSVMSRSAAVANGFRVFCCCPDGGWIADFNGRFELFGGRVVTVSCEKRTDDTWFAVPRTSHL